MWECNTNYLNNPQRTMCILCAWLCVNLGLASAFRSFRVRVAARPAIGTFGKNTYIALLPASGECCGKGHAKCRTLGFNWFHMFLFKRLRATAGQGPNYVGPSCGYVGLCWRMLAYRAGNVGPILWLCWPMLASCWPMLSQKIRKMGTAKKHCKTHDILMVGGRSWGDVGPSWAYVGPS